MKESVGLIKAEFKDARQFVEELSLFREKKREPIEVEPLVVRFHLGKVRVDRPVQGQVAGQIVFDAQAKFVGLVGARRGPSLVAGFRAIEGVDVTAICDINPEYLEEQGNANEIPNRFADYDEMLKSDIDLVVVATPMQLLSSSQWVFPR